MFFNVFRRFSTFSDLAFFDVFRCFRCFSTSRQVSPAPNFASFSIRRFSTFFDVFRCFFHVFRRFSTFSGLAFFDVFRRSRCFSTSVKFPPHPTSHHLYKFYTIFNVFTRFSALLGILQRFSTFCDDFRRFTTFFNIPRFTFLPHNSKYCMKGLVDHGVQLLEVHFTDNKPGYPPALCAGGLRLVSKTTYLQ